MTHLPLPLVDAEIDLTLFRRIELPVELLSDPAFTELSAAAFRAQVNLVFEAWRGAPPASISAVETAQARMAGMGEDVAAWRRVRDECLAHWTYCSDGRFYFEPIAPAVEDAWERVNKKRGGDAWRKKKSRLLQALEQVGVGVDNLDWFDDRMVDLRIKLQARNYWGMRGEKRRDALIMAASESGLMPHNYAGVADVRLAATFGVGGPRKRA